MTFSASPYALVVGLCAHGIAIVQALAAQGVRVVAMEHDRKRAGCRTTRAEVVYVENVNTEALVDAIEAYVADKPGEPPVLYLTNDNMVRVIGRNWSRLEGKVRLSWSGSRDEVLHLLNKESLAPHCEKQGLNYPRSWVLESVADFEALVVTGLAYPMIMKPAVTLTGFKVRLVEGAGDVRAVMREFPGALPAILQQWIPGGDRTIRFCAMYLDDGVPLASFVGRKLGAVPPAMGQAIIAEPYPDDKVLDIARRFFDGTGISGPVALEVKIAPDGTPWVIEPNVGRTEYLVDCCVTNGVDFPFIEYLHQIGKKVPAVKQERRRIWFDIDRAPLAYLRFLLTQRSTVDGGWTPVFPYRDQGDPNPQAYSRRLAIRRMFGRVRERVLSRLSAG